MSKLFVTSLDQSSKKSIWANHVKQWEESNQSQPDYCKQAGISYASFVYWRGKFLSESNPADAKFIPVKIQTKSPVTNEAPRSIQIKLISGHIIYIPTGMNINDISVLINAIGKIDA